MYHPDDHDSLCQMLGVRSLDDQKDVEEEYDLRRRMFCAGGGSGPLGPIALITLARSFNLGPPKQAAPDRIDFRSLPPGKTRVQTYRYSDWHGGTFVGLGDNGQIYVRLDGDEKVLEICNRPDVLRLEHDNYIAPAAAPPAPETIITPDEPLPDYLPTVADEPAEGVTTHIEPRFPDPPAEDDQDDEPGSAINWGAQEPGTRVWLQDGAGDVQEGVLSHTDESGVFVLIDGAERFSGPYEGLDVYLA